MLTVGKVLNLSIVNRLISALLAVLCIVLATVLLIVATGRISPLFISNQVHTWQSAPWETAIVALAIMAAAWYLLVSAFPASIERALVHQTELGVVRVSLRAIEQAVQCSAAQVAGVDDVKAVVTPAADGVDVQLALVVRFDAAIPTVSTQVQQAVESYLRGLMGVFVGPIAVEIKAVTGRARRVD